MADGAPGFGWVVDDASPIKRAAGGPAEFARALASGELGPCAADGCPTCALLEEPAACVGVVEAPISRAAEQWLVGRLPASIDTLPGMLLRQNLADNAITGAGAAALRERGMMAADKPLSQRYGPFFRGVTITTDQLLEELLCAGDIQPAHALAVLVHLDALEIDDASPRTAAHGALLAELVQRPTERPVRARCTIEPDADADRSTVQLQRLLRALYAAFAQDTELRVFGG